MKFSSKSILKYFIILIINSLIIRLFIVGLSEIITCILNLFIITSLYKTYKKHFLDNDHKTYALKDGLNMILISFIVFITYSISEAGFLSFLPALEVIYEFKFINILSAVIFAPIAEEILFRGILMKELNQKRSFIISNILQSIIFSLLHFDIYTFIFSLFFSIVLGIISKYFNIYCCIFIHFLNNLLVVVTVIYNINIVNFTKLQSLLISMIFSLITSIILYKVIKGYKKSPLGST